MFKRQREWHREGVEYRVSVFYQLIDSEGQSTDLRLQAVCCICCYGLCDRCDSHGSVEFKAPFLLNMKHQVSSIQILHHKEEMLL